MKVGRVKIILILILMSLSIGFLVYSFAYTTRTHNSTDNSYLMVSEISFGLTDSVDSINLAQQTPTIDKFGVNNDGFSFSITNTSIISHQYTLRLVDKDTVSTIENEEIRYQLTRNGIAEEVKTLPNSGVIDSGVIGRNDVYEYKLVIWLAHDSSVSGGEWKKVIKVEAGTANIDISGANQPILTDEMIPVYYDDSDEKWKIADEVNSNPNYQWYNYDDRVWANAVTVKDSVFTTYKGATLGTPFLMDDIEMFYVWIPRFKYNLLTGDSTQVITVSFEKGLASTGGMSCTFTNGLQTCTGATSYTHPAFNFGGENLTGFWINKFEISTNDAGNYLSKPNQTALTNKSIGELFTNIRKLENTNINSDGSITNDDNNYDIHLARNFEMSAVSYLIYSQYGKYTNKAYEGNNRHVFDAKSSEKTGSAYLSNTMYDYNVDYYGIGASSTGNIYGVYDLNGDVSEYVMLNVLNSNNGFNYGSSGFTNGILNKYYDASALVSSDFTSFYGDGIAELKNFTSKTSTKPTQSIPFIARSSVTSVTSSNGSANDDYGARAVISVDQDIYITKW